jgi:hypothetical protein
LSPFCLHASQCFEAAADRHPGVSACPRNLLRSPSSRVAAQLAESIRYFPALSLGISGEVGAAACNTMRQPAHVHALSGLTGACRGEGVARSQGQPL